MSRQPQYYYSVQRPRTQCPGRPTRLMMMRRFQKTPPPTGNWWIDGCGPIPKKIFSDPTILFSDSTLLLLLQSGRLRQVPSNSRTTLRRFQKVAFPAIPSAFLWLSWSRETSIRRPRVDSAISGNDDALAIPSSMFRTTRATIEVL